MKFKYKVIPVRSTFHSSDRAEKTLRPIIPIRLINNIKSVRYEVLIDSGADDCLFHDEIADILGFTEKDSLGDKDFIGIGGSLVKSRKVNLGIEIGGVKYSTHAYFAEELGPSGYGIVGQRGFFDLFRIKFEYSRELIEITPDKQ